MNHKLHKYMALLLLCGLMSGHSHVVNAAQTGSWQNSTAPIDESNPQAAMLAAEERFRQAEKDFTAAENAEAKAALSAGSQQNPATQNSNSYTAPVTSGDQQQPAAAASQTQAKKPATQRRQDIQTGTTPNYAGSPQTGYSGMWTEPGSGDVVTSVIAPSVPVQTTPVYPMIIEPVIGGSDWSGSSWNNGSQSWQGGNMGGAPGYMPPPPPGMGPGMNNPGMQTPPAPGYRPLRPHNPSIWQPGMQPPSGGQPGHMPPAWGQPGAVPPPPGSNPGVVPPRPGGQPGSMPPQNWGPGMPPSSNWQPGIPPQNQPGQKPPAWNPGNNWQPGFPPQNQPGQNPPNWNPGNSWQPGPGWQPGAMPPGRPPANQGWGFGNNFQPAPPPGGMPATMRPLPMTPAGTTWGAPRQGNAPGMFAPAGRPGPRGSHGGF